MDNTIFLIKSQWHFLDGMFKSLVTKTLFKRNMTMQSFPHFQVYVKISHLQGTTLYGQKKYRKMSEDQK